MSFQSANLHARMIRRFRQQRKLKEESGHMYESDYDIVRDLLLAEMRRTERLRQDVAHWRKKALYR
jgi:hypothetical protein